ncbi:hypothetical protein BA059_14805 [Mycolicibacterium sp. (ex Dasyatis americana)]|nr:hypothetical protein BA059_14805 [Mycolicibacterium sp. (ex Dasyatis americana)]
MPSLPPPVSADNAAVALDLSALLGGTLGYRADEFVSICHDGSGVFASYVTPFVDAADYVATLPDSANIYFGVNPINESVRENGGRGKAEDVTRLAALYADLDFKTNGCRDTDTANAIIDDLAELMGTRPSAITSSGNGLHPYWTVLDGQRDNSIDIGALLKRWGRLVKAVAQKRGAHVDSVFDLPRVLRAPGTFNCKPSNNGHGAISVVCYEDTAGHPLALAGIDARLTELGIPEEPDDREHCEVVSRPDTWAFADETCNYVKPWIDTIAEDDPTGGRHQWLLSQAVRLSCAWRLGCITQADYERAQELLDSRMMALCSSTEPKRAVPAVEVPAAFAFGIETAATKTTEAARDELGGHEHRGEERIDEEAFWDSCDELRNLRLFARARRVGPWAMFGMAAVVVTSAIPPHVVLPPLVGSYASLNLYTALVGPSGSIKSAAMRAALDWLKVEPAPSLRKPGSGEGLAKCYARVEKPKGEPARQIGKAWSVIAEIPEVDTLTATGGRGGSTLMSELRSAWSGERLGFDYAAQDKAITLCAHRYRLAMVVGVQPLRAEPLFAEADSGTPQRFAWFPTSDPDCPDVRPEEPEPLELLDIDALFSRDAPKGPINFTPVDPISLNALRTSRLDRPADPGEFYVLGVPDAARVAVEAQVLAALAEDRSIDPLDGHKLLCRLKLAAAIAVMRSHTEIAEHDWDLAGIAMQVSDRTRAQTLADLNAEKARKNVNAGKASGIRRVAEARVVADEEAKEVERVSARVIPKLVASNEKTMSGAELRRAMRDVPRELFDMTMRVLEDQGRIASKEHEYRGQTGCKYTLLEDGEQTC